jgi:hypothetical protein
VDPDITHCSEDRQRRGIYWERNDDRIKSTFLMQQSVLFELDLNASFLVRSAIEMILVSDLIVKTVLIVDIKVQVVRGMANLGIERVGIVLATKY